MISKHVNIIFCSDSPSKVSHLSAINEALQGKIRLLENRIARLQDDVETNNLVNANTNNGMTAIMMSRPKKSRDSKPVIFKRFQKKNSYFVFDYSRWNYGFGAWKGKRNVLSGKRNTFRLCCKIWRRQLIIVSNAKTRVTASQAHLKVIHYFPTTVWDTATPERDFHSGKVTLSFQQQTKLNS